MSAKASPARSSSARSDPAQQAEEQLAAPAPTSLPSMKAVLPLKGNECTESAPSMISTPTTVQPAGGQRAHSVQ